MANRIMLNETSYHGAGAIEEIANEAKAHDFKKAFVCSDPDLIKFGVTKKVTDVLDKNGLAYEMCWKMQDLSMKFILISKQTQPLKTYSMVQRHSKNPVQIILSQLAEDLPWILPKQLELSLQIRSLKM